MEQIANRLKNERKRLNFTQKQIAEVIGVGESSWNRYEKYSAPFDTNMLIALHQHGFDIMYILLGVRPKEDAVMISDDFLKLYTLYNQLDKDGKDYFYQMAELFVKVYQK